MPFRLTGGGERLDFTVQSDSSLHGVHVRRDAAAELSSIHVERFEVEVKAGNVRNEQITRDIPNVGPDALEPLDERGVIREGVEVRAGTLMVGRVEDKAGSILSPEEKLLRAIFGEAAGDVRDTSVRCPPDLKGRVTEVYYEKTEKSTFVSVTISDTRALRIGDVLEIGDTRAVVSAIVEEQAGELLWSGPAGTRSVAKVDSAESRMEARSIGPYSLVTQQPLGGKAAFGGQLVSAAQLRALEAAGAWHAAVEMLGVKSDDVMGRTRLYEGIIRGDVRVDDFGRPESASVLLRELGAMGFAITEVNDDEADDDAGAR